MGNYLALVNKNNPLNSEDLEGFCYIECEKEGAKNEDVFPIYLEEETYMAFMALKEALKQQNINLKIVSGRRTPQQQQQYSEEEYKNKLNQYLEVGQDETTAEANAREYVDSFVARPLESEHHTGLCLDGQAERIKDNFLTKLAKSYSQKVGEFSQNVARKIMALDKRVMNRVIHKNLEEYGFILRYKEEDYDKIGVHGEPWHYRFVGRENAEAINKSGLCLEEYLEKIKENAIEK